MFDSGQVGERWMSAPEDLGRILSTTVDGISVIAPLDWVTRIASTATVPVISICSGHHSPMDALAMLYTIRRSRGTLRGQRLAVVGDGASVASGALLAGALAGMTVALAHPRGFAPNSDITTLARDIAARNGGAVLVTEEPAEAVEGADVVVVDPWSAKGGGRYPDHRCGHFDAFQVNRALMAMAKPGAMILHQGPIAMPLEIEEELAHQHMPAHLDWAANRVHMSKALFLHAIGRKA
jgi:ornithine carbamoyltransferase